MGLYDPLQNYLEQLKGLQEVRLRFKDIEALIKKSLPPSAYDHREWWANQRNVKTRPHAAAWTNAGYEVSDFDQDAGDGWVIFKKVKSDPGPHTLPQRGTTDGFVKSREELRASVRAFMSAPDLWKEAVGSQPKYFVHLLEEGRHHFGLSKFCAFRGLTLLEYVGGVRKKTEGGTTQNYIKNLLDQKEWVPLSKCAKGTRDAFVSWFSGFAPDHTIDQICLLPIDPPARSRNDARVRRTRSLSPQELQKRLARQIEIGQVGEQIALKYEIARLKELGAKDAAKFVEHVSQVNVAAGFDIKSNYRGHSRYIEVKSTTEIGSEFFVSNNEVNSLRQHGAKGYLYLVHVENVAERRGAVTREIADPFESDSKAISLTPVLFQALLKNSSTD